MNRHWMRKICPDEVEALMAQAHTDKHEVIAPSHVFLKDKELVGYASVAQVPLVLPWFDTRKCRARDSLYFINACENLIAECMGPNQQLVCVPFVPGSPFEPHIQHLGFVNMGKVNLTFKKVK
jgi:hypothetical protein